IYNQRNHKSTTHHTLKIPITRLLCECELYAPSNYDNDSQMKEVMDNFNKQTQQRFHEYDERMKTTRQKCKDKCDKEIQKIILKDKMEKQMAQQLTTLETKIDTNDIPTCICEKSMVDKMEKGCLRCGGVLGGGIAPTFGLIGSVAINMWKTTEIAAATKAAIAAGETAGKIAGEAAGVAKVIELIESTFFINELNGKLLESVFTAQTYTDVTLISKSIYSQYSRLGCGYILSSSVRKKPICNFVHEGIGGTSRGTGVSANDFIKRTAQNMVSKAEVSAKAAAKTAEAAEKAAVLETSKKAIEATSYN
ncbi:hypothetical protein PFTANZ_06050, partial [Plasmodium falciparum Tanzania (2000708)]